MDIAPIHWLVGKMMFVTNMVHKFQNLEKFNNHSIEVLIILVFEKINKFFRFIYLETNYFAWATCIGRANRNTPLNDHNYATNMRTNRLIEEDK